MAGFKTMKSKNSNCGLVLEFIVRTLQIASSIVTASAVYFFMFGFIHGRDTFLYLLAAASHFTIITLALTTVLSCCVAIPPLLDFVRDMIALAIWGAGFGLLAKYEVKTGELNICKSDHGSHCTWYKMLFVAAFIGCLSTLFSVLLSIQGCVRARRFKYTNLQRNEAWEEESMGLVGQSIPGNLNRTPAERYEQRRGEAMAAGPGPKPGIKRTLTLQLVKMSGSKRGR